MAREGFLKDKCGPRAKKFEHHWSKGWSTTQHCFIQRNVVASTRFLSTVVLDNPGRWRKLNMVVALRIQMLGQMCVFVLYSSRVIKIILIYNKCHEMFANYVFPQHLRRWTALFRSRSDCWSVCRKLLVISTVRMCDGIAVNVSGMLLLVLFLSWEPAISAYKTAVFGCLTNALAPPPNALESCSKTQTDRPV